MRGLATASRPSNSDASEPFDADKLLSHLPDLIFRLDRNLRHLVVTGDVERMRPIDPARLLGKTGRQLRFPRELCDRFEAACRSVLRSGKPRTFEAQVRGVWIRHRLVPERGKSGRISSLLVIAEDATEQHRNHLAMLQAGANSRADLAVTKRLVDLGVSAASTEDLAPVLTGVVDAALAITGADFGDVQLLDPANHTLHIVAHRGFPKWWHDVWNKSHKGDGACGTALRRGTRVIVEDIEKSPIFQNRAALDVMRRAGVRSVHATPLKSRAGSILGMFSVHYRAPHIPDEHTLTLLDLLARRAADLIEQSRADTALRRSEDKYRTLFTNIADQVHLWRLVRDRRGRIVTWRLVDINPAGLKGWSKARRDTVGRTADQIFPGATRRFMPIVRRIFTEGRQHSWESYFPTLGKHVRMSSVPFGEYFVTTGFDITATKRAALALQISEERLRLALEAANLGAFDWDLLARKITWTPNTEKLWGLRVGSFKGTYQHWRSLLHPDDRRRCEAMVKRAIAEPGTSYEVEHRIIRPGGSVRWIAAKATVLRDAEGKAIRMVGINTDITDQRAAQKQLEGERDRLDRLVRQRTEEALRVQEQARVSERLSSLGTLAAGLGHDMNNMLLPLQAHLNVAAAVSVEPEVRRSIRKVEEVVKYLQQQADALRYLAADDGMEHPPPQGIRLHEWWRRTGSLLGKAVPRHVRIQASLSEKLPPVLIGMHGLTQAVLNLIVNAAQAIPPPSNIVVAGRSAATKRSSRPRPGLVRVLASKGAAGPLWRGRRSSSVVRLSVQDNGSGMTDSVKRRAFDLFFTTKPRGLGTGLGLPLVARVVESVGGSVRIRSSPGRGTTVTLILPVASHHVAASPRRKGPASTGGTAVISIGSRRTLSLLRHLLHARGVSTPARTEPGAADLVIAEPTCVDSRLLRWLASSKTRARRPSLILLGAPTKAQAAAWKSLEPIIVEHPNDYFATCNAVDQAIALRPPSKEYL